MIVPLYAVDDGKVLFHATVIQETIIPDILETGREHMRYETEDEFLAGKRDLYGYRTVYAILCSKGDGLLCGNPPLVHRLLFSHTL